MFSTSWFTSLEDLPVQSGEWKGKGGAVSCPEKYFYLKREEPLLGSISSLASCFLDPQSGLEPPFSLPPLLAQDRPLLPPPHSLSGSVCLPYPSKALKIESSFEEKTV